MMGEQTKPATYTAKQVYESFQSPQACRELVRMLLDSGLFCDILKECAAFAGDAECFDLSMTLYIIINAQACDGPIQEGDQVQPHVGQGSGCW